MNKVKDILYVIGRVLKLAFWMMIYYSKVHWFLASLWLTIFLTFICDWYSAGFVFSFIYCLILVAIVQFVRWFWDWGQCSSDMDETRIRRANARERFWQGWEQYISKKMGKGAE